MPRGVYPRSPLSKPHAGARQPVIGERFGRLTVISTDVIRRPRAINQWQVRCDCGQERWVQQYRLCHGITISCGCWAHEKIVATSTRHGMTNTPEYHVWRSMHNRCSNPRDRGYANYGGRGITVCQKWASFEQFYDDMGARPSSRHSIDRIDNDGPYTPGNCRWATATEQQRNRRCNKLLSHEGRTMPLSAWAEAAGLSFATLNSRLKRGWNMAKALDPQYRPLRPGVNAMTSKR